MITRELSDQPRGRGRPRAFDRRKALEAALRLFWARGYEGSSIAELTHAMGINAPALYAAFGSKEALYKEVLGLYQAGPGRFTADALAEELTAFAAIARVLREAAGAFAGEQGPLGCMISTAILGCAREHDGMAQFVAGMRIATREALADRIRQGIEAGELPPGTDAASLAGFYGAVIQGMSVQAKDGASRAALLAIAENALHAWPR